MSQKQRLSGTLTLLLDESLLMRGNAVSETEGQPAARSRNRQTVMGLGDPV